MSTVNDLVSPEGIGTFNQQIKRFRARAITSSQGVILETESRQMLTTVRDTEPVPQSATDQCAGPEGTSHVSRLPVSANRWPWQRATRPGNHGSEFSGEVRWVEFDAGIAADDHTHLVTPGERLQVAMAKQ